MEVEEEGDHLLLSETDCVDIAITGDRDEPRPRVSQETPSVGVEGRVRESSERTGSS